MRYLVYIFLLTTTTSLPATAEVVKKSYSGICHDQHSSYFERTKNFKPSNTLNACLPSDGSLPKERLSNLPTSNPSSKVSNTYSREMFGRGWDDRDGDCQNSRHEALIAQSTGQVRFKTGKNCRVVAGRWISSFTGAVIHDPSKIDIDHVVPLKWAWDHGAKHWPQAKRERFANEPANLLSVEASLNRRKGAKGPDEWLPPKNQCQYVLRFIRVMKQYQLKLSNSEEARYNRIRKSVCAL